MSSCTCERTCWVHWRSARSYCAGVYRSSVRRLSRHVFSPSSHAGWSAADAGPGKKTSLGGGRAERFMTPVCEMRSWRGFHSSAGARLMNKTTRIRAKREVFDGGEVEK